MKSARDPTSQGRRRQGPCRSGALALALLLAAACSSSGGSTAPSTRAPQVTIVYGMTLTSTAFHEGGAIPKQYTCDGKNVSPPLRWFADAVPPTVVQLALVVSDPDAPVKDGFVHWIVVGIPKGDGSVDAGTAPPGGRELQNDAGRIGYTGPCPPSGTHHYHFTLYALRAEPNVDSKTNAHDAVKAIGAVALTSDDYVGTYARS